MRKIPDIPSRKPKDQAALRGLTQPYRNQAFRITEREETNTVPEIGYFAGANAWNG